MTTNPRLPIAVYGTLRPGCGNDRLWHGLAEARYDGDVELRGFMLVSNGGFPYLLADDGSVTVGALIEPAADEYEYVLRRMDGLEGYHPGSRHNHYERVHVVVHTPEGPVLAWTYVPATALAEAVRVECPPVEVDDEGRFDWTRHTVSWRRRRA